jgi:CRISPR-associated protein Cas1
MISKVIEISQHSADLIAHNGQLELRFHEGAHADVSVPCEDVGLVVIDNGRVTYTHHAVCELMDNGAAVLMCGPNHLPTGLLLPWPNHTLVMARLRHQIAAGGPLKKRLWQQLVATKIRSQAANVSHESSAASHLRALARRVRSGDPGNVEARAAKVYWRAWRPVAEFRRNPEGKDALNAMLNYGYAIVRAAMARALVGAGLQPALGLHHANRSNAFCLADDLMEPLRPLVDARVRALYERGERDLSPEVKRGLLSILTQTVQTGDTTGPLMASFERVAASLARCYTGEDRCLVIPSAVSCEP